MLLSRPSLAVLLVVAALLPACSEPDAPSGEAAPQPVRVEVLHPGPHAPTLLLMGRLEPAGSIALVAPASGIVSYPARFAAGLRAGEAVSAGEALAMFEAESARRELEAARVEADHAAERLDVALRAVESGVSSRQELSARRAESERARVQLESAQREAGRLVLTAPASGTLIVETAPGPGASVAAGTEIARLALSGRPRVEAAATAADRAWLVPGLPARLRSPGTASEGRGRVVEVGASVSDAGTVRVVVAIDDWASPPLIGEGADVTVELPPVPAALTVPEGALVIGGGGAAVFVSTGSPGRPAPAQRRSVTIGRRGGGRVEIAAGLNEGDHVIVEGAEFLADGDRVLEQQAGPAEAGR